MQPPCRRVAPDWIRARPEPAARAPPTVTHRYLPLPTVTYRYRPEPAARAPTVTYRYLPFTYRYLPLQARASCASTYRYLPLPTVYLPLPTVAGPSQLREHHLRDEARPEFAEGHLSGGDDGTVVDGATVVDGGDSSDN